MRATENPYTYMIAEPVRATLEWLRTEFGVDLRDMPIGHRTSSASCPIANALKDKYHAPRAGFVWVSVGTNKNRHYYPKAVQEFIKLFDRGDYPQYLEVS